MLNYDKRNSPRIIRQEPFKRLAAIEWEDRDSGSGSSRSRALVGLSRAFRASLVSAVKSCSVRTSQCASTPRCFKPPSTVADTKAATKSRRHSSVRHFTEERATPCPALFALSIHFQCLPNFHELLEISFEQPRGSFLVCQSKR